MDVLSAQFLTSPPIERRLGITVRVRSQLGMWRFRDVNPDEPARTLMARIETEKNVPVHQQTLSTDPGGTILVDPNLPLCNCGVSSNGDVIHLKVDEQAEAFIAGPTMVTKKKIGADGSIVAVLDIAKCMYDAISKIEKLEASGKSVGSNSGASSAADHHG